MTEYWAIIGPGDRSRLRPSGIVRRRAGVERIEDEVFAGDNRWHRTPTIKLFERNLLEEDLEPLSREEALVILDRWRRELPVRPDNTPMAPDADGD